MQQRCRVTLQARQVLGQGVSLVLLAVLVLVLAACGGPASPPPTTQQAPPAQIDPTAQAAHACHQAEIAFEHLTVEDGLSQSSIFAMAQDSQGFMWYGTQDGLSKYDGNSFVVYRHVAGDPTSLSGNHVRALHADGQGGLWIGTRGSGLDRLDRETGEITHFHYDPRDSHSLSNDAVHAIHEDGLGALWIGTEYGLNRFDREQGTFTRYLHQEHDPDSLSYNVISSILEDHEGALWIGTAGGGLDRFDRETETFAHYQHNPADPASLSSNVVEAVYEDGQGVLWVGTANDGLNRLDRPTQQFSLYRHNPMDPYSLGSDAVQAIYEDRCGSLWIGTSGGGLARFDRATEQFTNFHHALDDPGSLSHDWVQSIYQDESGALWVGTSGGGLNKVDCASEPFTLYRASPASEGSSQGGLSNSFVWSLFEDRDGALWIGTFGGGLNRFDRQTGQWQHYGYEAGSRYGLSNNIVRSIGQDSHGALWIGTEGGGLNYLQPDTGHFRPYWHNPSDAGSLSDNAILSVYVDDQDNVWVGTWSGLSKLEASTGRFVRYQNDARNPNSLSSNVVRSLYQDSSGIFWVGTEAGLDRFDPQSEEFSHYASPAERHDPGHNAVLSIAEDSAGNLWLGTFGGGLRKLDPESKAFTIYQESSGLPSNVVYGIIEDDDGLLWLSTNKGLSRFYPKTETFANYDVTDGLQSNEFNAGAYARGADGTLFFGGINGFNAFHPSRVAGNTYVPPVALTALQQGGVDVETTKPVESIQEITFRWPNNFFEFEFAALSYCQPERNRYAYMLEGFDRDWVHTGTHSTGRYTNLPGKTYTLRLKGANNDGIWNEAGAAIKVTVVPPFWATWWFRGTVLLVVVGGVIAGYRLRVRNIERRSRALEQQVAIRTRELQERTHENERRRQELEALYRADAELHRYLRLGEVLQALVDIAVDILEADKSSLLMWDDRQEELVIRAARGFGSDAIAAISIARGQGIVGQIAATGKSLILEDTLVDPPQQARLAEMAKIVLAEGIRSCMFIPIKIEGEVVGIFNINSARPHAFGRDEERLFEALAQRAALAIDTAQLYEQTKELAVVEERSRLARELHDAVTQTLFSASLIAEALPDLWENDRREGQQLLGELRQLSRGAMAEMRTLLMELRPAALTEADLGDLVRQLAEAVAGRTGVPVNLSVDILCPLPADVHVAFYRIAQESLNNVVKHANASRVIVKLRCTLDSDSGRPTAELEVSDDGLGFNPEQIPPDRLGLGIIRERAQAIGAELEIDAGSGQGTRVSVRWQEKEDQL